MRKFNKKRGFTLTETVIAASLSSAVIGATVGVFGFTVNRVQNDTRDLTMVTQGHTLADEIAGVIASASDVRLVQQDGSTALLARVPEMGMDSDEDGTTDTAAPVVISASGLEIYSSDTLTGFAWMRDTNGVSSIQRLRRPDSSSAPWALSADPAWAQEGDQPRWRNIRAVSFRNFPLSRISEVTIVVARDTNNPKMDYVITRTMYWGSSR